ncbi:MAG: hypothetical protein LBD79_02120 [Treponema sp.]|jgi:hypothetical protein|nr:hypothetical protein [Treponema sp.]
MASAKSITRVVAIITSGLMMVALGNAQTQGSNTGTLRAGVGTVLPQSQPLRPVVEQPQPEPEPIDTSPTVIKPGIPPKEMGGTYRIQVGAYTVVLNAVAAFDKVIEAGLSPLYERNGEYLRVVLTNVRPEEVSAIAEKLGKVGFRTALIRAEGEEW